jgi:hypothetical protein
MVDLEVHSYQHLCVINWESRPSRLVSFGAYTWGTCLFVLTEVYVLALVSGGGYNKQRQVGGRSHSNKLGRPPRRLAGADADADADHAADSPRLSVPIATPSSAKQPPRTTIISDSQSSKKRKLDDQNTHTSSSSRKKIGAGTSTPLSRLLASKDDRPGSSRQGDTGSAKKKKTTTSSTSEKPLDPSIMRRGTRSKQEQDEDDEIAWLEWKLGAAKKGKPSGKGKGKGKAPMEDDEDDGLDGVCFCFADTCAVGRFADADGWDLAPDLLNFADSIVPDSAGAGESDGNEEQIAGSEEEDDAMEQVCALRRVPLRLSREYEAENQAGSC